MTHPADLAVTAFDAGRRVASGPLAHVLEDLRHYRILTPAADISVFVDGTGERLPIALDLEPSALLPAAAAALDGQGEQVLAQPAPRRPGRPRLGVVAREVTLLPEHWEWLSRQDGGASVTLRNLVDQARQTEAVRDQVRLAHEAAYRYLQAAGSGLPGYEDALRALHAGDAAQFEAQLMGWPEDMREYARSLAFPNA